MSSWGKNNPDHAPKKSWSLGEAKGKLETYCAYQERCQWEVRRKLYEKGIKGDSAEELISEMISSDFLNEERFARSFARGKFRLRHWGKMRIARELKLRQISPACIRLGLSEIDPEEYYDMLLNQAEKKWEKTTEMEPTKKRYKVVAYLMAKGFEQDLVQEAVASVSSEQ
ncbi:RecX family transcriptional regulator [Algoriphagus aestuariicola]|jgi:regulatory protein|uniref:Regulatory protein RecX n=1 Tax=Algoriphagus aestuariicola TaxID=1852016 RepID=A0ABS3BSC5_9BACT|nr:regulatory protein RecX [Algoriphagus aestuariicola]MBN7802210.1 RecX family transcriptional regulator [Algoriphagus aestuariicola]